MRNAVRRSVMGVLMAGVCLLAAQGNAIAQDKPVTSSEAWVKLPEPGATSTVAFAEVHNPGMYAIYLLSGTTDVAGKLTFQDAGKGNAETDEVTVPAYETTYLNPKGIHMVLSGLKRPLKEGETINITLKTELGLPVEVAAVVKKQ